MFKVNTTAANALKQIADAISTITNSDELFFRVHQIVGSVIDASNFYIALTNMQLLTARWLYFVDERDSEKPGEGFTIRLWDGSLTYKTALDGCLVEMTKADIKGHYKKKNHQQYGPICEQWIGIPIKNNDSNVIGVLVVQSYTNPAAFSNDDKLFLTAVADLLTEVFLNRVIYDKPQPKEKKFQNLIEHISDAIYASDYEGRIFYLSPAIEKITGYSPEQLNGKRRWYPIESGDTWSEKLIHPDDQDRVKKTVNDAIKSGSLFEVEYRIVKKNKQINWVVERGTITKGNKDVIRIDGIISDIHQKKQAENINEVLFQISEAVNSTEDLAELYDKIHQSLKLVIDVENFYIALYDREKDILSFLFDTDKNDPKQNYEVFNASKSSSLTAEVVRTGQTLLLNKAEQIEQSNRFNRRAYGVLSEIWLGIPLFVKGKVIGVMVTQSYTDPQRYDERDVAILNSVSEQIAIAIDRKQAQEKLVIREKLISTLYQISTAVHKTSNLDQLYLSIHQSLNEVIDARNFTIVLYDEENDILNFKYSTDLKDGKSLKPIHNASQTESLTYKTISGGQTLLLNEKDLFDINEKLGDRVLGHPAKSWVGVPLKGKNRILGAIVMQDYDVGGLYSKKEVNLLTAVSDQVATAIERKQYEEQLKTRETLITSLYCISNAIPTAHSIEQLCQMIHEALKRVLNLDNFVLALYDEVNDRIEFAYKVDKHLNVKSIENASKSSSFTYEVIRRKETVLLDEPDINILLDKLGGNLIGHKSKSWLGVPLKAKDEVFGAIVTQNYHKRHFYSKKDIEFLTAVSEQISFALQHKKAETELAETQSFLIDKAHQAGMAEIVTDTLHNVGNLLNSVKTSSYIISQTLNQSKIFDYKKANNLLKEHLNHIHQFFCESSKGGRLLEYYLKLENALFTDHEKIIEAVKRLDNMVDNISDVIAVQQNYAGANYLTDNNTIPEILADTLKMMDEILNKTGVVVKKDLQTVPKIQIQKSKLIHILVNLIKNASDSLIEKVDEDKELKISMTSKNKKVYLRLSDNGMGIKPEDFNRIFNHGFTTKQNGYGFGLHSCANYMAEMGGTMWAESDGVGKGATFVLEFPCTKS